jgi:hypothetical protein
MALTQGLDPDHERLLNAANNTANGIPFISARTQNGCIASRSPIVHQYARLQAYIDLKFAQAWPHEPVEPGEVPQSAVRIIGKGLRSLGRSAGKHGEIPCRLGGYPCWGAAMICSR